MESILTSIKKLLGIKETDENFDIDIIMHINTVFAILKQIGAGPSKGFSITDKTTKWIDYIPEENIEQIKTYIYLKVRLVFDPPLSTAVLESMKQMATELECRISYDVDPVVKEEEEVQNG